MTEAWTPPFGLLDEHVDQLHASGLSGATIQALRCYSISWDDDGRAHARKVLNIKRIPASRKNCFPMLAFPYFEPGAAEPTLVRVRPATEWSAGQKYKSPKDEPVPVYLPAPMTGKGPLVVTEGEKTAAAIGQLGFDVIGAPGVWMWAHPDERKKGRRVKQLHPWITQHASPEGRECVICFDADVRTKKDVHVAAVRLGFALFHAGATSVVLRSPEPGGPKGLDDVLYVLGEDKARAVLTEGGTELEGCASGHLPDLVVGQDSYSETVLVRRASEALAGHEDAYVTGGVLTEMRTLENGRKSLRAMTVDSLRLAMCECANWMRQKGDNVIACKPPSDAVREILSYRKHSTTLRPIHGISRTPSLRPDGSVACRAGYDRAVELYLDIDADEYSIPHEPTTADVEAAKEALEEVVCDFSFAKDAHRSGFFAAIFTLLARRCIDASTPLFLFEAAMPGAGKSTLGYIASIIGAGEYPATTSYSKQNEELDKKLASLAMEGVTYVFFDNVDGRVHSAMLAQLITTQRVKERVLGHSAMWDGYFAPTWLMTANNLELGDDFQRRTLPIALDPQCEKPETRPPEDFKHHPLIPWVQANAARLTSAALTILRAYCVAGRPAQQLVPWGSFEQWSALVAGAIVWAGWPDPITAQREVRHRPDPDRDAIVGILTDLRAVGRPITVRDFIELTRSEQYRKARRGIEDILSLKPGDLPTSKKLSGVFRRWRGRIVEGMRLDTAPARAGVKAWRVLEADDEGGFGGNGGFSSPPHMRNPVTGNDPSHIKRLEKPTKPHKPTTDLPEASPAQMEFMDGDPEEHGFRSPDEDGRP